MLLCQTEARRKEPVSVSLVRGSVYSLRQVVYLSLSLCSAAGSTNEGDGWVGVSWGGGRGVVRGEDTAGWQANATFTSIPPSRYLALSIYPFLYTSVTSPCRRCSRGVGLYRLGVKVWVWRAAGRWCTKGHRHLHSQLHRQESYINVAFSAHFQLLRGNAVWIQLQSVKAHKEAQKTPMESDRSVCVCMSVFQPKLSIPLVL